MYTKGIISHHNVDWPRQDCTQGLAREQPSVELPEDFIETFAKVRVIQKAADSVANKPGTRILTNILD